MSAETHLRPRPQSHAEQMAGAAANYERQVDELRALAAKRFWELYFDEQLKWHGIRDQLGRIVQQPRPLAELRGFFAGQPPQA